LILWLMWHFEVIKIKKIVSVNRKTENIGINLGTDLTRAEFTLVSCNILPYRPLNSYYCTL